MVGLVALFYAPAGSLRGDSGVGMTGVATFAGTPALSSDPHDAQEEESRA